MPGKIEKYDYLTGEKLLPLSQRRIIEQARFMYPLVGKTFEKLKKKTIEFQRKTQVEALKSLHFLQKIGINKKFFLKDKNKSKNFNQAIMMPWLRFILEHK